MASHRFRHDWGGWEDMDVKPISAAPAIIDSIVKGHDLGRVPTWVGSRAHPEYVVVEVTSSCVCPTLELCYGSEIRCV